jgi:hypothetical protein
MDECAWVYTPHHTNPRYTTPLHHSIPIYTTSPLYYTTSDADGTNEVWTALQQCTLAISTHVATRLLIPLLPRLFEVCVCVHVCSICGHNVPSRTHTSTHTRIHQLTHTPQHTLTHTQQAHADTRLCIYYFAFVKQICAKLTAAEHEQYWKEV